MVATPAPQVHHGMVTEMFYTARFKVTPRHVLQLISHHLWIALFAKELVGDSEKESMEMKSRRGTIFKYFIEHGRK